MKIVVDQDSQSRTSRGKKSKQPEAKKKSRSKKAVGKGFKRTSGAATAAEVEAKNQKAAAEEVYAPPVGEGPELGENEALGAGGFVPPSGEGEETLAAGGEGWPTVNPEAAVASGEMPDPEAEDSREDEEPFLNEEEEEPPKAHKRGAKTKKGHPPKAGKSKKEKAPAAKKTKRSRANDALNGDWDDEDMEGLPAKPKASTLSNILGIAEVAIAMAIFAVLGTQVGTLVLNNTVAHALGG